MNNQKRLKILRKENNILEKELSKENKRIMTEIVLYLQSFPISIITLEQIRKDISLMLLNGEENQQSTKEILGDDYRLFCDNIVKELPRYNFFERNITLFGMLLFHIAVISLIIFCMSMISIGLKDYKIERYIPVSVYDIIAMIWSYLWVCGLIKYISRFSFQSSILKTKIIRWFIITYILIIFFLTYFFDNEMYIKVSLPLWLISTMIICVLLYCINKYYPS